MFCQWFFAKNIFYPEIGKDFLKTIDFSAQTFYNKAVFF